MTSNSRHTVVSIEVMCEPRPPGQGAQYSFGISEYARTSAGDLVVLRSGLGWSMSAVRGGGPTDPSVGELRFEDVAEEVRHVTLPDDDAEAMVSPHPWGLLTELAEARGLLVPPDGLESLPYRYHYSESVLRLLRRPR